jgi:hypothetical protein
MPSRVLATAALLCLCACTPELDMQRVNACDFAAEALHPDGSRFRALDQRLLNDGRIQITYRVQEPDRPSRVAQIACGFIDTVLAGAPVLASVEQNGRALSEVRLLILKRWWMPLDPRSAQEPPAMAKADPWING